MRKLVLVFIAFLLIALPINGAFTDKAHAASSRVAVIKELKGTVKVKKAGGSKEFTAFAKMSLNEGDVLSVGSGGSAMLQFANGTSEDDKMTVSANTKLSFSKLSNKKGTTTKVSMWSGNAWVDVKSIASASDEFTLETPTAVMGVRGTHFFVNVNPVTGVTNMTVAAGIVQTSANTPSGGQTQNVYPTQQVIVMPVQQSQANMLKAPIDVNKIVSQSSPEIIKAFLQSASEIVAENNTLMGTYLSQLSAGKPQQEKERLQGNIENIVGAIASSAKKESQLKESKEIQDTLEKLESRYGKDFSNAELTMSDEERSQLEIFTETLSNLLKQAEDKRKREQLARDLELLAQLQKKQEEQKKAAEEAIKKKRDKAFDQYESQLDQQEKDRLKKDKDKLTGSSNPGQSGPSTSGGSSNGSGSTPPLSQDDTLSNLHLVKYEGESSPPAEPTSSAGEVELAFTPTETAYSAQVSTTVSYVNIKPVASNAGAKITVNGSNVNSGSFSGWIPLNFGNNDVTIVVTAADGVTKKTYHVQLKRLGTGRLVGISGIALPEAFDPEVFQYEGDAIFFGSSSYLTVKAESGSSVIVKLNGESLGTYETNTMYKPNYVLGENDLEVIVTPEIGAPVTYTFSVFNWYVVQLSNLIGIGWNITRVDSFTYSGVVDSSVSSVVVMASPLNYNSVVEVFKGGSSIPKTEGAYVLSGLTSGWNEYTIRVTDPQNRLAPQEHALQIWKGETALSVPQAWTVSDNNGNAGKSLFEANDWFLWTRPDATSVTLKPIMDGASPFTVNAVGFSSQFAPMANSINGGQFQLPVEETYTYYTLWLENDGKLIGREISPRHDYVDDYLYGLDLTPADTSDPLLTVSETEVTTIVMPAGSTSLEFEPKYYYGVGGKLANSDPGAIVSNTGMNRVPYDGVEKTFTITYKSIGEITQKAYTVRLVPPPAGALTQLKVNDHTIELIEGVDQYVYEVYSSEADITAWAASEDYDLIVDDEPVSNGEAKHVFLEAGANEFNISVGIGEDQVFYTLIIYLVTLPAGIDSWTTTAYGTEGAESVESRLNWINITAFGENRYFAILPFEADSVTFSATLAGGAQGKFDTEDPFTSDELPLTISEFDPSGYTTFKLITSVAEGSESTYTFTLISPSVETPDFSISGVEASYWDGMDMSSPMPAEKSGDAYYLMFPYLQAGDPIELAAIPGNESNRYLWVAGGPLLEQNEESGDHVTATPVGLNIYLLIVTDPAGISGAMYPVYVYQGIPNADANDIYWDAVEKQWVMDLYYDSNGDWSTPFDLRLPPGVTASIVSESGNINTSVPGTLSGHFVLPEEILNVDINVEDETIATYTLKIILHPSL